LFSTFSFRRTILFTGPIVALLLTLAGMLAFHVYGSTFAASAHTSTAPSHTLFVSHTPVGSNTSCSSPGYMTVQAAVDAAHNGDTVYLCGTTPYQEQVVITKSIKLTGDPGATIKAPSPFPNNASRLPPKFTTDNLFLPQAIVIVWGAGSNANIVNLNITGPLPGNGGCADDEFGVLVIAGGEVRLKGDHVTNIHDTNSALYGCQFGVGIQIGRRYWHPTNFSTPLVENFTGQATITKTTVTGYQKNGISVDGPGSEADISYSTVEGAGRDAHFAVIIAQNGIQISRGAVGTVQNNFVADNSYTGPAANASSGGILVFGGCGDPLSTDVEVEGNVLSNNDVGIYLNGYSSATDCSAPATQETTNRAINNTISNDAVTNKSSYTTSNNTTYPGYQAGIDDIGNNDLISGNTIAGIGYTPAQLASSGPLVIPIDTISFPTIHPRITGNRII